MEKIPFSESEMDVMMKVSDSQFRHTPAGDQGSSETLFSFPISRKDNFVEAMKRGKPMWLASARDSRTFTPRCVPDNEARAFIIDGGDPVEPHPEGFKDMFGIEWVYVEVAQGSMVRPGNPLLEDMNDWKDFVTFPDLDSFDWDTQEEISREYVADPLFAPVLMIQNGWFERMISFMDFENAAIAIVDEDQEEAIHEFFDQLADFYIRYIDIAIDRFNIAGIELHDDWGTQASPFFSPDVARTMIAPYIKRVADHVHSRGLFYMMHSCGNNFRMVPIMIEAGVDFWTPQYPLNDQSLLYKTYGTQIGIAVVPPVVDKDASEEEVYAIAQAFVDEFVNEDAPTAISIYASPDNHPLMEAALYRLSRIKLCGVSE